MEALKEHILEATSGKSEANLQDKSGISLPERLASRPHSKKFSGPSVQPHRRVQNKPIRAGARTWYRSTNQVVQSITKMPKPVGTPSSLPASIQRVADVASAYVRKGNSLVRASSAPGSMIPLTVKDVAGKVFPNIPRQPHTYSVSRNMIKNVKPAFKQVFTTQKVLLNDTNLSSVNIEKNLAVSTSLDAYQDSQGLGPLCSSEKLFASVTSEACQNSSASAKGIVMDDRKPKVASGLEANDRMQNSALQPKTISLSVQSALDSMKSETLSSYYVKSKANQIVASMPYISSDVMGKVKVSTVSGTTHDVYYKRKNNQLVRNDGGAKGKALQDQASRGQEYAPWHSTVRKGMSYLASIFCYCPNLHFVKVIWFAFHLYVHFFESDLV